MRLSNLFDWRISRRLWFAFGVLMVILAVSTLVSSLLMHSADQKLTEAVDIADPLERACLQMKISAAETSRSVTQYVWTRDASLVQIADDAEESFEAVAVDFLDLADTSQIRELGQQVARLYEGFKRSRYQIFTAADEQYAALEAIRQDIADVRELVAETLRPAIDPASADAEMKLNAVAEMETGLLSMLLALERYVTDSAAGSGQDLTDAEEAFNAAASAYRATGLSVFEDSWFSRIESDVQSVRMSAGELVSLRDEVAALLTEFHEDYVAIEGILDGELRSSLAERSSRAADDAGTAMTAAIVSMAVLGALGLIAGGLAAGLVSRRIIRSLASLESDAAKIADGKFEHRFFVGTQDEFAEAGFSLNRMLDHLMRSRDALGESEETAWALLDATTDSVILTDTRGIILASNEVAANRFGKSLEQMVDLNYYDLLPADIMASRKAQMAEVARNAKPLHFEDERDGIVYDERIFPVMDHRSGKVARLALFSRDITTRKWVEEVAERLGRRNELILEAAGEGIYGLDTMGRTTFVNPAAARMLGYRPEDLIGERHHELVHHSRPDGSSYPHHECPIYTAFKDGAVHSNVSDEVFWRKDGTSFHVEYTSTPIIEDGKIAGAVVTFRDISERREVEMALRQMAERYRMVLDSAATLIISVDRDGSIVDCNARSRRVLGYTTEEMVGRALVDFVEEDFRDKVRDVLRTVLANGFDYSQRFRMLRKDRTTVEVNMNAAAAKDENGEYVRTICMIDTKNGGWV